MPSSWGWDASSIKSCPPSGPCLTGLARYWESTCGSCAREGPADALESTDVSQPAIFVASLAALESLKVSKPEIVADCQGAAGLSLGEYTALVFAGAMDFESGLKVVRKRGQAMQAAAVATASGMTSVLGLDEPAVDELCRRDRPFRPALEGQPARARQHRRLG